MIAVEVGAASGTVLRQRRVGSWVLVNVLEPDGKALLVIHVHHEAREERYMVKLIAPGNQPIEVSLSRGG